MRYCPDCRAEYEDEVQRCSDCGAGLLPGHAPEEPEGSGWEVVRTLPTDEEAALVAGFLQSEGIDARIEAINVHPLPETIGDLSGVMVRVEEAKLAEAQQLLDRRDSEFARMSSDEGTLMTDDGPARGDDFDEMAD